MSENSAIEKFLAALKIEQKETTPNSCGCGKCSVEITCSSGKFKTRSLHVAAGVNLAKRLYCDLDGSGMLLWAQQSQPGLSDKVQAIYQFCECAKILEYAGNFEDWKDAVKTVQQSLNGSAIMKKKHINIRVMTSNTLFRAADVNPYDDVQNLSHIISWYGRLTFDGKQLTPGRTFADYQIVDGSEICMN